NAIHTGAHTSATTIFFYRQPNLPLGDCRSCSSTSFRFTLLIFVNYNFRFFGSFCFSFSTVAKRSRIFSTRARVLSERNFKRSAFFFFKQLATSSQVTGVETVGSSLARRE